MSLQKTNAFLLYKACIFKLKPNFFSAVTIKMVIQFTFLSKTVSCYICAIKSISFYLRQIVRTKCRIRHCTNLHFFFFFLQSVEEGTSEYSFFLYIAFIDSEENNKEVLLCIIVLHYILYNI